MSGEAPGTHSFEVTAVGRILIRFPFSSHSSPFEVTTLSDSVPLSPPWPYRTRPRLPLPFLPEELSQLFSFYQLHIYHSPHDLQQIHGAHPLLFVIFFRCDQQVLPILDPMIPVCPQLLFLTGPVRLLPKTSQMFPIYCLLYTSFCGKQYRGIKGSISWGLQCP